MRQLVDAPYRYEDYLNDVALLRDTYPDFITVFKIGESLDHRDLYVIKVGDGSIPIIITAGVHARETINTKVIMRIIENYVELARFDEPVVVDFAIRERIGTDSFYSRDRIAALFYRLGECVLNQPNYTLEQFEQPNENDAVFQTIDKDRDIPFEYNVRAYLEEFTFYIMPLVNPDGYEIALGGFEMIHDQELREIAIKQQILYPEWKGNARGVDINRNFPSITWKTKFPGDTPESEPETQALIYLFDQVSAKAYLDLHSRGKAIYYHKGVMQEEYNERQHLIADRLRDVTGYELMPPETEIEPSDTGGNTVHYFSEYYKKPAITIETVTDMEPFPLDVRHQTPTYEEIFLAPLEFASVIVETM